MKRLMAMVIMLVYAISVPCFAEDFVADGETGNTTPQMRYVNQFFTEDGALTEMGLALYKWLDMDERTVTDRIDSGYLMLEEEYVYHKDTLFQSGYVFTVNKAVETISSVGVNLGVDFANHQLMKSKFGDAGAFAVPYYEYFAEIYLSFLQDLEREMSTMDVALDKIIEIAGDSTGILLEDGLPAIVKKIKKSDLWSSLTVEQKYALDAADKMMSRQFPPLQKYQQMIDTVGISFDFAGTAASWVDLFETKENLSLQQQMYMAAFSKVTDEHMEALLQLRENLHKHSTLSPSVLQNVDGAIGALLCDIFTARNNHMEAAAQADWNVKLGTYKSLCNAIYATAEFGVAFSRIKDILSTASGVTDFSIVTAVAKVGEFALSLTTQDYLDVRESTEAIYNLKLAMVESLVLQLNDYTMSPSHEKAVGIIASLNLLKQAKLAGEEMISMFYLAREAELIGLENSPQALAILWNELITGTVIGEFNAEAYTESICTVYENSVEITGYHYDANIHNGTIQYKVKSTPIAHYAWPSISTSEVSYQGVTLDMLPSSILGSVRSGKWRPTDELVREMTLTPATALMAIQNTGHEYVYGTESKMSKSELERLAGDPVSYVARKKYNLHREKEYVYSRGNVEVRISADDFEKYLSAEQQVERLLNEYRNISAVEYSEHQTEERLIWTWVTNKYIESFPMFDPSDDYSAANDTTAQLPVQTDTPLTVPDADWSKPYKTVKSQGRQDPKRGTFISSELFGKVLWVQDAVGGWFYFVAPQDGTYSFSVLAPDLSRSFFSIEVYEMGADMKYQRRNSLRFERSAQIQTHTITDVKAGEAIYWWDNDGSGRGYTLIEPFALMIAYQGAQGTVTEGKNVFPTAVAQQEMPSQGILNLDTKSSGNTEISDMALVFERTSLRSGQMIPVYSAPSNKAWRGSNGKSEVSTNEDVWVAGWDGDWLLIYYETSKGSVRVGYVNKSKLKDDLSEMPALEFAHSEAKIVEKCSMTDDVTRHKASITTLSAGTKVVYLAPYYAEDCVWAYIEARAEGKTARGFVPMECIDLANK